MLVPINKTKDRVKTIYNFCEVTHNNIQRVGNELHIKINDCVCHCSAFGASPYDFEKFLKYVEELKLIFSVSIVVFTIPYLKDLKKIGEKKSGSYEYSFDDCSHLPNIKGVKWVEAKKTK